MTAEIAILNRTAIAFAADSAATISGPLGTKTYDSAEKIFEICRSQPIALMVYNNASFMGVPFEVLVRAFREGTCKDAPYQRLTDVAPRFRGYLLDFPRQDADEDNHLQAMCVRLMTRIRDSARRLIRRMVQERAFAARRGAFPDPNEFLAAVASRHAKSFEAKPLEGYLSDKTLDDFKERYGATVKEAGVQVFDEKAMRGDVYEAFLSLMFAVVRSKRQLGTYSGFVIGGFGVRDIFPSLVSFEVDGVFFGRLRLTEGRSVDIDRRGDTSAVIPSAQKEMVERFIYGVDSSYEKSIGEIMEGIVQAIFKLKPRSFPAAQKESIINAARSALEKAILEMKSESEQAMTGVLEFLSKRELAEMAYSLVELTSRKRKFSSDLETVGGPIDVAVLTKNEGFIWIRRKHYFDKDLNPGYFARRAALGTIS